MKEQERGYKRLSKELLEYLKNSEYIKHKNHGYEDYAKAFNHATVMGQLSELEYEGGIILFDTALCQPFLCWKNNELNLAGVLDYDISSQLGTFRLQTKEGELIIPNVHSYHIFYKHCGKFLPCRNRKVPEEEDLLDVYVSAVIRNNNQYDFLVFHNRENILEEQNVFECEYISDIERTTYQVRRGYVIFARKTDGKYRNYLCDIVTSKIYELDSSNYAPSWYRSMLKDDLSSRHCLKKSWFQSYRDRIIEGFSINVIVHIDNSKTAQIVYEYIKRADKCVILKNLFEEDTTLNIMATFTRNHEAIAFLNYCCKKYPRMFGHGIMGLSIEELEVGSPNSSFEFRNVYNYSPYYLSRLKHIYLSLYEMCGEHMILDYLPEKIYEECISSHDMEVFLSHAYRHVKTIDRQPEEIYDDIFQQLAQRGELSSKWKNEYALYMMVVKKYKDAIYQYHAKWLKNQSLDVYIPSLNLAIEYQGLQHYEAVEHFGGEEQLILQKNRDSRKRELCIQNGIKLMEWRYDEPISPITLMQKLREDIQTQ